MVSGCQTTKSENEVRVETLQKLMLFRKADVSRDQQISLAEFQRAFSATGEKSVEELFGEFDLNGNQLLSQKEWVQIK